VLVICALALNVFCLPGVAHGSAHKYEVITTNGRIMGHSASGLRDTVEFLGVPYARPPVGRLRFAKPLPLKGKADYNASDWV
jgi:cholinesterase